MSRNLIAYYERQAARFDAAADTFRSLLTQQPRAPDEDRATWTWSADYLARLAVDYRKTAESFKTYTRPTTGAQ